MSTAIALYAHELIISGSNHCDIDVVYLDYRKAFDSVPHDELLLKPWKYGVTGDLWSWFKAYLTARGQCVRVCNQAPEYLPVISGVPQGSLLGPLLYIFYINDMFTLFTVTRPFTFADDTKLLITLYTSEDCDLFQQDLQELATWNNRWHLQLNTSKCFYLHYHFSNAEYSTMYKW